MCLAHEKTHREYSLSSACHLRWVPYDVAHERSYTAVEEPLTITSFALSLLLVFRTNASYARFAEARQLWGLTLNRSRDLVRQAIAFFPTNAWDAKATFARWVIVFSKALLCHLRAHSSLRDEVAQVLSKQEMQILFSVEHPVVMTVQVRLRNQFMLLFTGHVSSCVKGQSPLCMWAMWAMCNAHGPQLFEDFAMVPSIADHDLAEECHPVVSTGSLKRRGSGGQTRCSHLQQNLTPAPAMLGLCEAYNSLPSLSPTHVPGPPCGCIAAPFSQLLRDPVSAGALRAHRGSRYRLGASLADAPEPDHPARHSWRLRAHPTHTDPSCVHSPHLTLCHNLDDRPPICFVVQV
jgi:hypothetical protein